MRRCCEECRRCEPAQRLGEAIQVLMNHAKPGLLRPNAARARNDDPHGLSEHLLLFYLTPLFFD